jgi:hypothetical protein
MPRGGSRPNTGGAREGSGRKPGSGWASPRPLPVREAARIAVKRALAGPDNPIDILLSIAGNDDVDVSTRVVAAAHAAPYMFPKLSASVVATTQSAVSGTDVMALMSKLTDRIGRLAPPTTTIEHEFEPADQPAGPAE